MNVLKWMMWLLPTLLTAVAGSVETHQFEQKQDIEGHFELETRGRLRVSDALFTQSRTFPADIRILGSDGTPWPFFLHHPKAAAEQGRLTPEILNTSFVEGDISWLQFDLLLPDAGSARRIHNQLELFTTGHDFIRRVEIYSVDPQGLMGSGYLINFSGRRNAHSGMVRYPDSDASRLHVRIYANAQDARETFQLASARMVFRQTTELERQTLSPVRLDVPDREREEGAQTLIFDFRAPGRPVEYVVFDVETPSFARSVSAYGRNAETDPWRWVGGGVIHKLEEDLQNEIKLNSQTRFLKVHIYDYDDKPLVLRSVELQAVPRYLVFEAASAGTASVWFRAWDLKAPRYDLKKRITSEELNKLPLYALAKMDLNEGARSQAWRNYSNLLAGLAVGVVSLLVIGIIVRMLKQQQSTKGTS